VKSAPPYADPPRTLPVRPPLLGIDDEQSSESLVSWLSRLAWANGFRDVHTLLAEEGISFSRASDVLPRSRQLQLLQLGGLDEHAIKSICLGPVLSLIGANWWPPRKMTKWILRSEYAGKLLPNQVCIPCLREQEVAYWSRFGRASFATQCLLHKVLLVDHCPSCGLQIGLTKVRTAPMTHCSFCLLDFRTIQSPSLSTLNLVPRHWFDFARESKPPRGGERISLDVLWRWIGTTLRFVCNPSNAEALLSAPIAQPHHRLFAKLSKDPWTQFDFHRADTRHELLLFIRWLIEGWPERGFELAAQTQIPKSSFARIDGGSSTWIRHDLTLRNPSSSGSGI